MFGTQRKTGGGMLLVGFGAVLAAWVAIAGVMVKSYYEGGSTNALCQVVCAEHHLDGAHG